MSSIGGSAEKGDALVAQAEKALKKLRIFGNKYEDASEFLDKAANQYKLAKEWEKAGSTLEKLAQCHQKLESAHEEASTLVLAANSYKKVNIVKAIECLEAAANIYMQTGKLQQAAKQYADIGDMQENSASEDKALEAFQKAADLYSSEESQSQANKNKLKVASLAAKLERYKEAIELFESVASTCLDNNLLKYSVRGHLLCAGICQLCIGDLDAARQAVENYKDMDVAFSDSREAKLLDNLLEAIEEEDVEKFTNFTYEYDSISKLDNWKTTLLLRVKKALQQAGEEDLT